MAFTCLARVAAAALALAPAVQVARADEPPPRAPRSSPASPASGSVVLEAGAGRVFRTGGTISSIFAADPKVVEVRPASHNSVFIFGVGAGRTTVAALDDAGNTLAQYNITVLPSSFGAGQAAATVRRTVPGARVQFSEVPDGIVVNGQVPDPAAAEQVAADARRYLSDKQTVENQTTITSSVQVTLRVRIAEISRNITRQLGINWTALANIGKWGIAAAVTDGLNTSSSLPNTIGIHSPGNSINTVLDLLAQDQLITMLAEPNLTARSGETASFLAGGEFPIPISGQNNQITVAFKQYGVSLAFVPTVLSDGRISLHVHPEVSELTNAGAVSLPIGSSLFGSNTITIPAITVRRADTTVELGSGQSFAVAGLMTADSTMNARGLPYAGEIPVLGALFKSNLFQRDQSELVIVVTPYIVRPVGSPDQLHLPTDDFVPAGDFDRVFLMRQRARGTGPNMVVAPSEAALASAARPDGLPANAGFILH
jgi:pilus assembly protein CpaC